MCCFGLFGEKTGGKGVENEAACVQPPSSQPMPRFHKRWGALSMIRTKVKTLVPRWTTDLNDAIGSNSLYVPRIPSPGHQPIGIRGGPTARSDCEIISVESSSTTRVLLMRVSGLKLTP